MKSAVQRRGLAVAVIAAAAVLASCGATQAELQAQAIAEQAAAAAAANIPPPVTLDESVAEAAAVYVAFTREMSALHGGFESAEAVQTALRQGSSYNPEQLSRGLVAYASILALQSPEFVAGVRQYSLNPDARRELVAKIVADPRQASYIDGAESAAQLVTSMLKRDIDALSRAANSVENDAYAVQALHDPRRGWGVAEVFDREGRLARTKALSAQTVLPSASEAAELLAAAQSGRELTGEGQRRKPPYPPVVERALAIAALAALGAGGESGRMSALQEEPVSERCLNLSKLMLYQCLAASRPSYEDMFCVGRHVVRDLATCTRGAAMPAAIVTVSDVVPAPSITPAPFTPEPPARSEPAPIPTPTPPVRVAPPPVRIQTPAPRPPAAAPVPTTAPTPSPAPPPASPASSITGRLNSGPGAAH